MTGVIERGHQIRSEKPNPRLLYWKNEHLGTSHNKVRFQLELAAVIPDFQSALAFCSPH